MKVTMDVYQMIWGFMFCVTTCISHNHQHGRQLKGSSIHKEGRIAKLDEILRRNIALINTNEAQSLGKLIREAERIMESMPEDDLAGYYVRLLTHIESKGIDFINGERDRLNLILGTTQGAEKEHARLQKNIVEGLVDMIADHLFLTSMTGDMDMLGNMYIGNMNERGNRHQEM